MLSDARRAPAAFALTDAAGVVRQSGEAEALIGDDGLTVGPVTASWLDADALLAAHHSVELELWPGGRLVLSQLGRRFDTFVEQLRRVRNQARVAGILAHGVTMPDVFVGAVVDDAGQHPAELQVYDTHLTIVPVDGDPWQLPFGAVTGVSERRDPPGIALETAAGLTMIGQLARQREACHTAIVERREAQRRLLAGITGQAGFADGWGLARGEVARFDELLDRFTADARVSCARELQSAAAGAPKLGFVQLLDPDREGLQPPAELPDNWAAFLLVPIRDAIAVEILAGPSAATYVFRGDVDAVNRDLQLLHFRRAPLALTEDQAIVTPANPHRLALRKLAPLARLRSALVARLIHTESWSDSLRAFLSSRARLG